MLVILTTYKSWHDPPSRGPHLVRVFVVENDVFSVPGVDFCLFSFFAVETLWDLVGLGELGSCFNVRSAIGSIVRINGLFHRTLLINSQMWYIEDRNEFELLGFAFVGDFLRSRSHGMKITMKVPTIGETIFWTFSKHPTSKSKSMRPSFPGRVVVGYIQ